MPPPIAMIKPQDEHRDPGNPSVEHRRASWIVLGSIIVGGMLLRLYRISVRSIWFDESSSWRTSQFPFREMLVSISRNNHVPLHYILLKGWIKVFGDSLFAMRGLSVLFAGLSMLGVYLFSVEAFAFELSIQDVRSRNTARWIGLFSAALVAINIFQVRTSWEVRMYALGTALVAISSWTLFRALRAANSSKWWSLHGLVTILFAYTHHFALLSIGAQVLFLTGWLLIRHKDNVIAVLRDSIFRCASLCYLAVAAAVGAWFPILLRQNRQVQDSFFMGPLQGWEIPERCYEMFDYGKADHTTVLVALAAAISIVLGIVVRPRAGRVYVACLFVIPFSAAIALSYLGRNILVQRYLIFAQLFLLIGIASLVARISNVAARNALAALILVNAGYAYADSWSSLDLDNRGGMREAVAYIQRHRTDGDSVIASGPMLYFPAIYYLKDSMECHAYHGALPFLSYEGRPIMRPADSIDATEVTKIKAGYVWLISGKPPHGLIIIPPDWQLVDTEDFQEVYDFLGVVRLDRYKVSPEK